MVGMERVATAGRSTTIGDVARAAGVSASTVSYVLSGKRSISAATRERVQQAIADLGYRPHAGARALASSRTAVIGLVAPLRTGVDVNVIMQFVAGIATRALHFEYDVLLLTRDDVAGIERLSRGSMVDALIVMDVEAQDPRIETLVSVRQPVVLIGLPDRPRGLSCVDLDFDAVGRLAVTQLGALGHRSLGLIAPSPSVLKRGTSYADRLLGGARAQAAEDGLTLTVQPTDPSHAGGREATRSLLQSVDVTGVIVHNEAALPGVLEAIREADRQVPGEIDVVAVGPPEIAANQSPLVSSIEIPAQQIGAAAVDMVMERLGDGSPAQTRLFAPELTARESAPELTARDSEPGRTSAALSP